MLRLEAVIPAQAGIPYAAAARMKRSRLRLLEPRLRGDDGRGRGMGAAS